jgi:hypothetical protein
VCLVFLSLLKDLGNSVFVRAIESKLPVLDCTRAFQTDAQVQSLDARAQCALTLDRTSMVIERTNRLLNSCTHTLDRIVPSLERISAINCNRPEAAKYKVFDFLVYSYFSLFVYFFVPVFFIFSMLLLLKKKKMVIVLCRIFAC